MRIMPGHKPMAMQIYAKIGVFAIVKGRIDGVE